jgi:hypothetical protein
VGLNPAEARCGRCAHFRNDRATLEAAMPGISSMSSGDASVRADDGICLRHDRYLNARASCADFASLDAARAAKAG